MTDRISETASLPKHVELHDFTALTGLRIHSRVSIVLMVDGMRRVWEEDQKGNGQIDTFAEAFKQIVPNDLRCDCRFDVVGNGSSASCITSITLSDGERSFFARCEDPDTVRATAKAYVDAFNRYLHDIHDNVAAEKVGATV